MKGGICLPVLIFLPVLLLFLIIVSMVEFHGNNHVMKLPSSPASRNAGEDVEKKIKSNIHELLFHLETGVRAEEIDFSAIEIALHYIDHRFDCNDFRMMSLIRILYAHSQKVPQKYMDRINISLLGAKFFMDQPGEDSVCYWSENHQIIFAASEYLIGQKFEDQIFTNDGLTGREHKAIAKERIMIWLKQRFLYGFTEWYSNTYYEEDIGPLSNLIDFCDDPEIVVRTKMILDLLLFDIAAQSFKGSFTSTSGRAYEEGKKSGHNSALRMVAKSIWGYDVCVDKKGLDVNFLSMRHYEVPEAIRQIGLDHSPVIVKASNGLNIGELKTEITRDKKLEKVMMQWAMEAFSNPEVMTDTVTYVHQHHMLSNEFLNDMKLVNLSVLKCTNLLNPVSRILRPITNGTAIQRANTYTYKTENYMLATAQNYHPGDFGDQQHIWCATVSPGISIFTTHPASPLSVKGALSASPNYWVGNGRNPHSVQDENINLTLYFLDGKKGFMEKDLLFYSHMYFPKEKFDQVIVHEKIAFAKIGKTFVAVIGNRILEEKHEELIQQGAFTCWITELSSEEEESFHSFMNRIEGNTVMFDENELSLHYHSGAKALKLVYGKDFFLNGNRMNCEYERFDSKYSHTRRKNGTITIGHHDSSLFLDFEQGIRKEA